MTLAHARRGLLVLCLFVCPLLFFTNLTRNPYVTQIALLNVALLLLAAIDLAQPQMRWPRTPLDAPIAAWLGVCAVSWVVCYVGHRSFFRPSIVSEGARNAVFLLVNAVVPFYLAARCWRLSPDEELPPLGPWAITAVVWGLGWTLFSQLRSPGTAATDIWGHVWDGYGALLWIAGGVAVWRLTRSGHAIDVWHSALLAGFLASVYGVLQYFNLELIWPSTLNPYGGRSVSTFGNPNFMSSFDVVLLPVSIAFYLRSRGPRRVAYGAVILALEGALLCSLTRSSWLGAAVAVGVLALSPDIRRRLRQDARGVGLLFGLALFMALLWPQSLVGGYAPSVVGRIKEMSAMVHRDAGPYSPWHQRLLIWTCAWLMGRENPITGKGFGAFELFYPFYQGPVLNAIDFYRFLRTHANNSHNEVLEVWAQTGLLGLGVFAWLWSTFFRSCQALWSSKEERALPLAAAAGAAGMLADNLLNVSLHFAVPAFLFWWAVGTAVGPACRERAEGRLARAGPWLARAGAGACVLLVWYWVSVWFREVHYFAGFKLIRQNAFAAAVRELQTSKAWGPPEVNSIYELGNAYARSERFAEADAAYLDALRANAGYDEIYFNRGTIQSQRLARLEEAAANFEIAWWINPLSPEVYNSLGNLYLRQPQKYAAQARELLARAVHFFPDNPNHWNNLGYLDSLEKRLPQAEADYTRALLLDPNLAVAERNLVALAASSGRRSPILDALRDLRELNARVARKDLSDSTLALASQAAKKFPQLPRVRLVLGSLLLARGRAQEAQPLLEAAAAEDPRNAWAHGNLAELYLALGRKDDAARELRVAAELDPQNSQFQARLKTLAPGS